ncbi:hypothetical protein BGW80DRAFT_1461362 [Lactifluus volemus]|nr:hypothetical protein BGW80DRAFT_1461362 [Lactifluus volemus]
MTKDSTPTLTLQLLPSWPVTALTLEFPLNNETTPVPPAPIPDQLAIPSTSAFRLAGKWLVAQLKKPAPLRLPHDHARHGTLKPILLTSPPLRPVPHPPLLLLPPPFLFHCYLSVPEIEIFVFLRDRRLQDFDIPHDQVKSRLVRALAVWMKLNSGDVRGDIWEMLALCRELLNSDVSIIEPFLAMARVGDIKEIAN